MPLILTLRRQRQKWEFKTSLVYKVSSRTAIAVTEKLLSPKINAPPNKKSKPKPKKNPKQQQNKTPNQTKPNQKGTEP